MRDRSSFADVAERLETIDGWLSEDQALRLWASARAVPENGLIIEIGSFRGRSTVVLASAAAEGVQVVAIDPHAGNDRGPQELSGYEDEAAEDNAAFEQNLHAAGVRDRVRHVRSFSDEAHAEVAGPIDVLFVDGAHRYGPALADLRGWGSRVRVGGTMLVHDAFSSVGVTAALARECFWSKEWSYEGRTRSLAQYRRAQPLRRSNLLRQVAQLPWFARNLLIKALIVMKLTRVARALGHREGAWPY